MRKKDVSVASSSSSSSTSSPSGVSLVKDLPLGCFPSSFNSNVLLCSSGLHELDDLLGGGVLVGGLLAVEQDEATRHWNTFARLFASEALATKHGLAVVGAEDADPSCFVRSDVAATVDSAPQIEQVSSAQQQLSVDGVKIAWRYKAQLQEKTVSGSGESKRARRCHWFDLSKNAILTGEEDTQSILFQGDFDATFAAIERVVERFNRGITDAETRSPPILRLVLLNFGSGLWQPAEPLCLFLFRLRALVRRSLCVCFLSIAPTAPRDLLSRFVDQSIHLVSFEGSQMSGASFPGFSGCLTLKKTISLFASSQWKPECRQFLFRRTRRTLQIERLYMPPEDKVQSSGLACATTGGHGGGGSLEF